MKPRETRRNVLIPTRMRVGASWSDAHILNLSSRGLLVKASNPPPKGSYLEMRRGPHIIVARVVWAEGDRAGLRAQDRIPDILSEEGAGGASPGAASQVASERRRAPRSTAVLFEESRYRAQAFQFVTLAVLGASVALVGYEIVGTALQAPLASVHGVLAGRLVN